MTRRGWQRSVLNDRGYTSVDEGAPQNIADMPSSFELEADAVESAQFKSAQYPDLRIIAESYEQTAMRSGRITSRRYQRASAVTLRDELPDGAQGKASRCITEGLTTLTEADWDELIGEAREMGNDLTTRSPQTRYRGQVVLAPSAFATLVHEAVGHLAEADNYARHPDDWRDELVSTPLLTVHEAGASGGQWAGSPVDDEGTACSARTLLQDGRLRDLLTDSTRDAWSSAQSSGHARWQFPPSGPCVPRMSRLALGEAHVVPFDLAELRGPVLIVDSCRAGLMNPATRRIRLSLRRSCLVAADGSTRRLRGGTITGGIRELLSSVQAINDDRQWFPSMCSKGRELCPVEGEGATALLADIDVEEET